MKTRRILLLIDSIINLILGLLLISYSTNLARFFGVPIVESYFYPNILGGIFIGIALALMIESIKRNSFKASGLGILGAICINLCGAAVLFFWLILGNLNLPLKGTIFLWSLDILLILISSLELIDQFRTEK